MKLNLEVKELSFTFAFPFRNTERNKLKFSLINYYNKAKQIN